jgi:hypothetical protein
MCSTGLHNDGARILDSLKESPVYDPVSGLYHREYNPITSEVNQKIIIQSNLWMAIAQNRAGRNNEAKQLMGALEEKRSGGLFISEECLNPTRDPGIFSDDQALASIAYLGFGDTAKAENIMHRIISSPLYRTDGLFSRKMTGRDVDETISTYKNGLAAIALTKLRHFAHASRIINGLEGLYDKQVGLYRQTNHDTIFSPDNNLLALVARSSIASRNAFQ